jgi:hypothetical protein
MKKLILVLTVLLVAATFLCADVYIKTKTHTGAFEMMGQKQPARDDISEQWIGNNKNAQVTKAMTTAIDLDKNKIFIIMHAAKNYVEASLPLDMSKILPEQMAQMMSMMKLNVKVNPNGQTKKIKNWNCDGYDVTMEMTGMMPITMKMKVWATTDVPFDWKSYSEKMYPAVMKAQSMRMPFGDDIVKEYQKIKGFQVAFDMTTTVMGKDMKVSMAVVEISKKAAPAGVYAPPTGYNKAEKLSMPGMGGM